LIELPFFSFADEALFRALEEASLGVLTVHNSLLVVSLYCMSLVVFAAFLLVSSSEGRSLSRSINERGGWCSGYSFCPWQCFGSRTALESWES
jgi:ribosomal protein S26